MKAARNKKHKPKPLQVPVIIRFDHEHERMQKIAPHQSLDNVVNKTASVEDWHTITQRLNIGATMAKNVFKQDAIDIMLKSLESIIGVRDRFNRIEKYGCTDEEFKSIGDGLNLTDEMQKICTRRQFDAAVKFVYENAAS